MVCIGEKLLECSRFKLCNADPIAIVMLSTLAPQELLELDE